MYYRYVVFLALLIAPVPAIADAPVITWASDPVRPDETVVLFGEGFSGDCVVELGQMPDAPTTVPAADMAIAPERWEKITPLQASQQCLKCVVPKAWSPGVWACRVRCGDQVSDPVVLNAPEPWWFNGDGGEVASPGGWLRVFGKSLKLGGDGQAVLRADDGRTLTLKPAEVDDYAMKLALPADMAAGDYTLWVHNCHGGAAAWRSAGNVTIRSAVAWPKEVFNVKDFGPRPGEALLAALKKAEAKGGGIVYLPRGRYPVKQSLIIPPRTILRGEAMNLVSLYWPDFDEPPKELISGEDYGIESLSLYCQNHQNVISAAPASKRFFARQVRIRANCFFMIEDVGKDFRKRHGPVSHTKCGAALLMRGRNFDITDCDIYASNYGLFIRGGQIGLVARNQIRYGGRGYRIEATDRLIFEDNLVTGANLLAIGNDIATFWSNYCRHIYYARNHVQQMFGADREMMTLDAGGGAYYGKIAAVDGVKLTLAEDPVFHDYAPKPHTNWAGAAVQILDGRGAGQYRFVTAHAGRQWQVDRPWTALPDGSSRIAIAPFRGRNHFIGNTFEDGGPFQLYGAAHDTIVAANKGSRMDGFLVWGLNPHGWGQQPSWGCQFLDNEILEGNGYGSRTASFGVVAADDPKVYDGPMVRGAIFRRNVCDNNAGFQLGGATVDSLVEHCVIRDADVGLKIAPTTKGILLRENEFEKVKQTELRGP